MSRKEKKKRKEGHTHSIKAKLIIQ